MAVGQTTARDIIIGIIIFGALITGGFAMIGSSLDDNNGNFSYYNDSLNQFTGLKANADNMADSTKDASPSSGPEGILSGLYESSFGAIRNLWNSITTFKEIMEETSQGNMPIKIPVWFSGLIITIVTVTFAFALIASWRKWNT